MRVWVCIATSLWASSSLGAEVTIERAYWPTANESVQLVTIRLHGEITKGDLQRVLKARKKAIRQKLKIVALELDSNGGDSEEGMRLADWVHKVEATVYVDSYCMSACSYPALVALNQGNLLIDYAGVVGVHQVWYDKAMTKSDPWWTKQLVARLRDYGVGGQPLKDMVETPSFGMVYFGYDKLAEWGAHTVEKDSPLWAWFN